MCHRPSFQQFLTIRFQGYTAIGPRVDLVQITKLNEVNLLATHDLTTVEGRIGLFVQMIRISGILVGLANQLTAQEAEFLVIRRYAVLS